MNDALMIGSQTEKEDFIDDLKYEAEDDIVDFFKRQSSYPAINIGHLGTLKEYQSNGIGSMIIDLVADTFAKHQKTGCQFITVDALTNARTLGFYIKNAFNFQTERDMYSPTRRMYRILINS
jgi:ribosomal protein S18 acetylase RimI-like enzyme